MVYDSLYGEQVRKTRASNLAYSDELVEACAAAIRAFLPTLAKQPDIIVPVPSLRRPDLVPDFAKRLGTQLRLPVVRALAHQEQHPPQADMQNSYQQAINLLDRFTVEETIQRQTILLIDDIADSRWTLTVLGDLLQRHGAQRVVPFVIATTNTSA